MQKKELEKKTNEDLAMIAKESFGLTFPEEFIKEDMVGAILYAETMPPLPKGEGVVIETIPDTEPIPLTEKAAEPGTRDVPAGKRKAVIGSKPADFQKDRNDAFNIWDTIYINETERKEDNHPVFTSVNGRTCTIPRGVQVPVRRPYVEVLRNAVITNYDPETMETTDSPRFAFQVIEHDIS